VPIIRGTDIIISQFLSEHHTKQMQNYSPVMNKYVNAGRFSLKYCTLHVLYVKEHKVSETYKVAEHTVVKYRCLFA